MNASPNVVLVHSSDPYVDDASRVDTGLTGLIGVLTTARSLAAEVVMPRERRRRT